MITPPTQQQQQQQQKYPTKRHNKTHSSCSIVLTLVSMHPLLKSCLASKALNSQNINTPMTYIYVQTVVYKIFM